MFLICVKRSLGLCRSIAALFDYFIKAFLTCRLNCNCKHLLWCHCRQLPLWSFNCLHVQIKCRLFFLNVVALSQTCMEFSRTWWGDLSVLVLVFWMRSLEYKNKAIGERIIVSKYNILIWNTNLFFLFENGLLGIKF